MTVYDVDIMKSWFGIVLPEVFLLVFLMSHFLKFNRNNKARANNETVSGMKPKHDAILVWLEPFCMEFEYSSRACVGFLVMSLCCLILGFSSFFICFVFLS